MRTSRRGKKVALLLSLIVVVVLAATVWQFWPRIRFWWRFEAMGFNAQGYPEFKHRQTGIVMVKLPGGTFWMGAQKKDPDDRNYDPDAEDDEGPMHEVALNPFLIAKFEVTQEQWRAVMGSHPSHFKGDNRPVEQVSWVDCQEFCVKAGLRLPTEARWEFACRGLTTGTYARTGDLGDMGWFDENSGDTTHPVGRKQPNQYGLHDIHGNVLEWCEDVFDPKFYSKPQAAVHDPLCTSGSVLRVVRGGSWADDAGECRSTFRVRYIPGFKGSYLGFRPAHRWPF